MKQADLIVNTMMDRKNCINKQKWYSAQDALQIITGEGSDFDGCETSSDKDPEDPDYTPSKKEMENDESTHLCRALAPPHRRKRPRRRGKRSGSAGEAEGLHGAFFYGFLDPVCLASLLLGARWILSTPGWYLLSAWMRCSSPAPPALPVPAGSSVLTLINSSLSSGVVPKNFKHAVVQPLIKKPRQDTTVLSNYRPISKLPFMSKILEKIVCCQLMVFLEEHKILEIFQSGFKTLHSTESVLLRVFNDTFLATDSGDCVILVLLDLTAAFDTVDHEVLISRLKQWMGIRSVALDWFRSYLADRTFCVSLGDSVSSSPRLSCGVPQGSVLGPLLFSLYLLPLGSILRKHGISFHCYADDSQIYVPLKKKDSYSVKPLLSSVVKSSFFQLRQLAKPILSRQHFETVIHAFVTTRLDYCNALYVGVSGSSVARLQMVQNAAARLLTGTRKHEHISPILASLHWLPIHFRISFKILLFTFKSLNGLAPPYLSELLQPYTPLRSLRSADQLLLSVPKTKRKLRGDRAFAVAAPKLWNDLPLHIRQASSLSVFKSHLKTHLFSLAF
ncbi:uncharacterized protein LOC121942011 [Plectropomus leopardus]|uniref:uncharacterized protein LOC121942011 n=1 Tax=Plectropomus leopardus TaxID=160734 RepID=UPI001C4B546E|nr:uncharacterized protein LOC121942011 [Plectropomus leopardus]